MPIDTIELKYGCCYCYDSKLLKEVAMTSEEKKSIVELKPFGPVIQICPVCGKVDVYKDDGHNCFNEKQNQISQEYYD